MGVREKIRELKEAKDAVILAHYYVDAEVQAIADFVGDSLELARKATEIEKKTVVLCGVYFMAETAKILNPEKRVLIPYPRAGCLMADMAIAEEVLSFKRKHPRAFVVTYVNSSADVKAVSDVCCTSANAVEVVERIDAEEILFLPDRHLGEFVSERVEKKIHLWNGYCPVHRRLRVRDVEERKEKYPRAVFVAHPECVKAVRDMADFVGSTSQIVRFVKDSPAKEFIVGTEEGTIYTLRRVRPDAVFVPAYEGFLCDQMKMITLERVLRALEEEKFEVEVPPEVAERARSAVRRMFGE